MTSTTLFRPACYGILIENGSILLTELPETDALTLPGGGVEPGEGTDDTVIREFREETGLSVRVGAVLGTDTYARDVDGMYKHSLRLIFAVTRTGGRLRPETIDAVPCMPRWVALDAVAGTAHVDLVDAGLRLWRTHRQAGGIDGQVHHIELWLKHFETDSPSWSWLLRELGYSLESQWMNGASYRLGPTYIVLETSSDTTATDHDRLRPGLNHLAFSVHGRDRLDRLYDAAADHGWIPLFADRYPHAGGPGTCAAYLANAAGFEVELSLAD